MYTYIYLISAIAQFVLLAITWQSAYMETRTNKLFRIVIICNILALLGYAARGIFNDGHYFAVNYVINSIIYVSGSLLAYFIFLTTIKRDGPIYKIASFIELFMLLFIGTTPWTHFAFYIDESGIYQRGSLSSLVFIANSIFLISWICALAVIYRNVEFKKRVYVFLLGLFELVAIFVQMISSEFKALYVGAAFILGIYYVFMMEVEGRYDQMTGVYSKRFYYSEIERLNNNGSYIVFVLDVNGLKYINDTFGHDMGDSVIKIVSHSAWEIMHSKAKIFRMGGDEFVGFSTSMSEPEINKCLEELEDKLEIESKGLGIDVAASAGYSVHVPGEDFQLTLKRADENMYKAKTSYYERTGKGRK